MPAYLSHSRFRIIKAWLDDVQRASRTPLPPLPTLPVESVTSSTPSHAQQTGQLQISPRIPQNILDNINQQIYDTVGRHDIKLILAGLPNPTTRPLNNRFHVDATAIIKEYYCVMELWDLLWVQQMTLDSQLRHNTLGQVSKSTLEALEVVKMAVREAEQSARYLIQWCRLQGLAVDFAATEKQRLVSRRDNHPCNLIRPFIHSTI